MASRAMIVVAGGTATRFGGDKLMVEIAGRPLLSQSIDAVSSSADLVVVATRQDLLDRVKRLAPDAIVVKGGQSRTDSEIAGLAAVGPEFDLIGIHDGARPLVQAELIEDLYQTAQRVGGAVPSLEMPDLVVERRSLEPVDDVVRVQTPQVFRGPQLMAAFVRAAQTGFEGHDTVDVMMEYSDLPIEAVAGDPDNVKVTFPQDVELVRSRLEGPSRSEPR